MPAKTMRLVWSDITEWLKAVAILGLIALLALFYTYVSISALEGEFNFGLNLLFALSLLFSGALICISFTQQDLQPTVYLYTAAVLAVIPAFSFNCLKINPVSPGWEGVMEIALLLMAGIAGFFTAIFFGLKYAREEAETIILPIGIIAIIVAQAGLVYWAVANAIP